MSTHTYTCIHTCVHTFVFTGGFVLRFCLGSFVRFFLSGRFCLGCFLSVAPYVRIHLLHQKVKHHYQFQVSYIWYNFFKVWRHITLDPPPSVTPSRTPPLRAWRTLWTALYWVVDATMPVSTYFSICSLLTRIVIQTLWCRAHSKIDITVCVFCEGEFPGSMVH